MTVCSYCTYIFKTKSVKFYSLDVDLYWLKHLLPYSKELILLCELHLVERVTWAFEVCSSSETVKQVIEDTVKAVTLYHPCQSKQEMSYRNWPNSFKTQEKISVNIPNLY